MVFPDNAKDTEARIRIYVCKMQERRAVVGGGGAQAQLAQCGRCCCCLSIFGSVHTVHHVACVCARNVNHSAQGIQLYVYDRHMHKGRAQCRLVWPHRVIVESCTWSMVAHFCVAEHFWVNGSGSA